MELVKVKPWGKDQGDFVVIESDSFDENLHELYDENEGSAGLSEDDANALLENLDGLNAKDLKKLCEYFEVEYTNKSEAVAAIKSKTEGGE